MNRHRDTETLIHISLFVVVVMFIVFLAVLFSGCTPTRPLIRPGDVSHEAGCIGCMVEISRYRFPDPVPPGPEENAWWLWPLIGRWGCMRPTLVDTSALSVGYHVGGTTEE